jgi:hypothetical protein
VPVAAGPTTAAGPELLAARARAVKLVAPGTPAHEAAIVAIGRFRECERVALSDWKEAAPAPVRAMRIAGVAT